MYVKNKFPSATAALFITSALVIFSPVISAKAEVISGYADSSTLIDPTTIGEESNSLTVTLPKGNPFDDIREGELPQGKLNGYTFTLKKIAGIDIHTSDGYRKAQSLTVGEAANLEFTDPVLTEISDASGQVYFNNLPSGLYLIEVEAPQLQGVQHKTIRPMLVLLPASSKDGHWIHDVKIVAKTDRGGGEVPPPTDIPDPRPTPTPSQPQQTPPPGGNMTTSPRATATPGANTEAPSPVEEKGPSASQLAQTGASIIGLIALAACFIYGGVTLVRHERKRENK